MVYGPRNQSPVPDKVEHNRQAAQAVYAATVAKSVGMQPAPTDVTPPPKRRGAVGRVVGLVASLACLAAVLGGVVAVWSWVHPHHYLGRHGPLGQAILELPGQLNDGWSQSPSAGARAEIDADYYVHSGNTASAACYQSRVERVAALHLKSRDFTFIPNSAKEVTAATTQLPGGLKWPANGKVYQIGLLIIDKKTNGHTLVRTAGRINVLAVYHDSHHMHLLISCAGGVT